MIKLINWLIKQHNKRVPVEDRIEVMKPETFQAGLDVQIDPSKFNEENKDFLENIIREKQYDLRLNLITQIHETKYIEESVEKRENSIFIKSEIKVFE